MNVLPTVEVIKNMAYNLRHAASHLDSYAEKMKETNDLSYAAEVLQEIANLGPNLRMDLLVTRPLREMR